LDGRTPDKKFFICETKNGPIADRVQGVVATVLRLVDGKALHKLTAMS
jgi:hypothetical protein